MQCCLIFQQRRRVFCKKIFLNVKIRQKGGRFHIIFTNLAMFSNFSTEKAGILLENLPECQNLSKGGPFRYNFYESCNVFQFFNREDRYFARKSF